jgi:glutamate synthase domain-containing protein 3
MTGGQAVILGPTGNNFGAGMTNGTAYVLDQAGTFGSHVNADSVALTRVEGNEAIELRALVQRHVEATGSAHAEALLANWDATLSRFWKVTPTAVLELQQLLMESTEGAAD